MRNAPNNRGGEEQKEIYGRFKELVNMSPTRIEKWLGTEESRSVGQDSGDGESIGRKSARKIVTIKRKRKDELTKGDYSHMQHVISYISRHMAQKPTHPKDSRWLFSLKNWGHDPMK